MSQPSEPLDTDTAGPLSTSSALLLAVRLKSTHSQILHALLSLASAALLIRVVGMLNQIIVTSRFGAGESMDAYFVASASPTLLALVLGNVIEATIIPAYARVRSQGEKEQASILFSTLLNLLIMGIVLLTAVMFILRAQILHLSAPGSDSGTIGLAVSLSPFTFPVLLLMLLVNYLECILNTEGQFAWPAYAGMLVPGISAVLVFASGRSVGVVALCIGMVLGLCLQLCVLILRAWHVGLSYRPVIDLHNPAIGLIMRAAWPVLCGGLINQASPLIDQIFASYLSAGSISAISYSLKIISVFSGVIFASVGRAAHPHLSRQVALNDMKAFKATLHFYLWVIGIATIVLSAFLLVLAHPLVQFLFQRGAFSAEDTNRTAITLLGFVVGLPPMAFAFIAFRAFSALGRTRILMHVAIFSLVSNAVFDYIFARYWQSFGIALATSAVYVCGTFIMLLALQRMIGTLDLFTPPSEIRQFIWKAQNSFNIPYGVRQQIIRLGIIIIVFVAGIAGVIENSITTLGAALASSFIVILLRYRYALLIIWVLYNALNPLPIFRGTHGLIGLTVPTLLLMACMPIKQTFKRLPALVFLFIYLLWVFASIGISALGVNLFLSLWVQLLNCVAIGILTINVLTTRRHLMVLIDTILIFSLLIALYGIYGYITKQNGTPDPTNPALFRTASIFTPIAPSLAMFLSLVIPLALYRAFTLRGFKRTSVLLVFLILIVTLGLTFTRASYISVPLSIGIMVFFLPSRKMKLSLLTAILALTVITVLLGTVGNFPIFDRFFSQDITTLNGRTYLWEAILTQFDPTQLLGNGFQASDLLLTHLQVGVSGQGVIGTSPHSLFLGTLYDNGIIGVILLTLIFIALIANIIGGMRKATGEQDHSALFAMALAVTVSALIESIDSNDLWGQAISIYFWIIIALPFALCWLPVKQSSEPDQDFFEDGEVTIPRMEAIQQKGQEQIALLEGGRNGE